VKKISLSKLAAATLMLCGLLPTFAAAMPWKNETARVRLQLPGKWAPVTAKIAGQRMKTSQDSADAEFYRKAKARLASGDFFLFEAAPRSKVRADLQVMPMGKPLRTMTEQDIRNLCVLWVQRHGENERPFSACKPRKLGIAWTADLSYEADERGNFEEYAIRYFRADGTLILFTVTGTREQAEALFRKTAFY
jgi:hypothetical protein